MSPLVQLLLVLAASPLLIFALHAVTHRALDRPGRHVSAHSSAFAAIAAAFGVVIGALWVLELLPRGSAFDLAATLAYAAMVFGALAILYIDVINVAETSLHMHLLLEISWSGSLDLESVREKYNESRMIEARLHRLLSMGQLRIEGEQCYLVNRSTLRFNAALNVWRRILGLPTEPTT